MSFFRIIAVTFLSLLIGVVTTGLAKAGGGHVAYATSMLNQSPSPINQKFKKLITQNQVKELRAYIASGVDINAADAKRISPIHYASYLGHMEALRMLIQRGVNLQATAFGSWTPLHYAAFGGHLEASNLLYAMGIPIDVTDLGGETPIFYAIESGNLQLVKWFVEHGANLHHANSKKITPLALAAEEGNTAISAYLQSVAKPAPATKEPNPAPAGDKK